MTKSPQQPWKKEGKLKKWAQARPSGAMNWKSERSHSKSSMFLVEEDPRGGVRNLHFSTRGEKGPQPTSKNRKKEKKKNEAHKWAEKAPKPHQGNHESKR